MIKKSPPHKRLSIANKHGGFPNLTFPMKAAEPPSRAIPTATLAGAPPGAFLNAGASANDSPLIVGTKSMSISPKHTTCGESLASIEPLRLLECTFLLPMIKTQGH